MEENFLFRLRNIKTDQFATVGTAPQEGEIEVTAGIDFAVDTANHFVSCSTRFEFLSAGDQFIVLQVSCEFKIGPDTWSSRVHSTNNRLTFESAFMQHLGVVTVGTARGVLHAKTEDSDFNKFYLPTVNVTQLVPEDISFPLEDQ